MFDERLAHFKRQIQPRELRVAFFQLIDAAEAVKVVVESAVRLQTFVECVFPGVAERRVADVVGQRDGFSEVFVEPQPAGDGAGDLRDFERMRESRAVVIVDGGDEDLCLAGHTAERGAVNDSLAVALVE